MTGKALLHIGKNRSKMRCRWTRLVFSKCSWVVWWDSTTPGKNCIFYSHLSLETVFPALKVIHNCFIKVEISFSWKCQFYHKLDPSLSATNIPCLKEYTRNLTKDKIKGTSEISISQLFIELGKIWKYRLCLHLGNTIFHIFLELGKNEKSGSSNVQKSQSLFVNCEKLGRTA